MTTQIQTSKRPSSGPVDDIQLTPNFNLREWRCKDGTPVPPQWVPRVKELAENLEVLRAALGGKPITIASGYRTPSWNKRSGAPKSQHLYARAADFRVRGVSAELVAQTVDDLIGDGKMKAGGLHHYKRWPRFRSWVHYDIRGWNARW